MHSTAAWWWSESLSNGEIVKEAIIGGNIDGETVYICGVPGIPLNEYAQVVIIHHIFVESIYKYKNSQ